MIKIVLGILIAVKVVGFLIAYVEGDNFVSIFKDIMIGLAIFIVLIAVAVVCAWLIVSDLNSIIG